MNTKADHYWNQFLASLPDGATHPTEYLEAFSFGTKPESADTIAALVLAGTKTSTGALAWANEADHKPNPKPGDFSIVLDGNNNTISVIETTEVRIIPFDEVDAQFAYDGGEDDRTLASWREMYWEFLSGECERIGREMSQSVPVVCERFRVVYPK